MQGMISAERTVEADFRGQTPEQTLSDCTCASKSRSAGLAHGNRARIADE